MSDGSGQPPELYHLPWFYEPFSAISHMGGAVLFLALGAALLWRGRGNRARLVFLGIFAGANLLQFSMSGLFHMLARGGTAHRVFERLDHGAIFILIAGTFTPVHGLLFQGWLRWLPLLLIWIAAVAGITLKTIFFNDLAEWLSLTFYLTLGWFGVISTTVLAREYGLRFVKPLLLGGVVYSVGAVMEIAGWWTILPGVIHPHELWHVAVLIGAFLHWLFVWQFANGPPKQTCSGPSADRSR